MDDDEFELNRAKHELKWLGIKMLIGIVLITFSNIYLHGWLVILGVALWFLYNLTTPLDKLW